jgi:RNA polymerase sigma-70 factor (ECF subfamily)
MGQLREPFLDAAGPARRVLESAPTLEERLSGILERARTRWPAIHVDDGAFVSYLGNILRDSQDPCADFTAIHAEDLFIAFACLQGDPSALAVFEQEYMGALKPSGPGQGDAFMDELRQAVRERVLVRGATGAQPKLVSYAGRGPLGGWLRVCAARIAIDVQRSRKPTEDDVTGLQATSPDPELGYMKEHYATEFRQAFRQILHVLPVRQRMVLRLRFLDGLATAEIGALYDVAPGTVSNWLTKIRQDILKATRDLLAARLGVDSVEVDSVMGLIMSRLDASLETLLREGGP